MPVTLHTVTTPGLTDQEIEAWLNIPVSIAVDQARDIGQIDPAIRPLNPPGQQPALIGRAVTVLCAPPDFGAVVHVMDVVKPGDVVMISAFGNADFAMIGDILGGHLRNRGCCGLVCDGAVRDVGTLAGFSNFSVYARFITPRGPASALTGSINLPVAIGGQLVSPGDLVLGDDDGLVALSPDKARRYLAGAKAKLASESGWIASLASGTSARATFGLDAPEPAR